MKTFAVIAFLLAAIPAIADNTTQNATSRPSPQQFFARWGKDITKLSIHDIKIGMHISSVTNKLPNPAFSVLNNLPSYKSTIEQTSATNFLHRTGRGNFSYVELFKSTTINAAFNNQNRIVAIQIVFDNITPDQAKQIHSEIKNRYSVATDFSREYDPNTYSVSKNITLHSVQLDTQFKPFLKIINTYTHNTMYTNALDIISTLSEPKTSSIADSIPQIEPPVKNLF